MLYFEVDGGSVEEVVWTWNREILKQPWERKVDHEMS